MGWATSKDETHYFRLLLLLLLIIIVQLIIIILLLIIIVMVEMELIYVAGCLKFRIYHGWHNQLRKHLQLLCWMKTSPLNSATAFFRTSDSGIAWPCKECHSSTHYPMDMVFTIFIKEIYEWLSQMTRIRHLHTIWNLTPILRIYNVTVSLFIRW